MPDTTWTYESYIPDGTDLYTVNMKKDYLLENDLRTVGPKARFDLVAGVVDTNGATSQAKGLRDGSQRSIDLEDVLVRVAVDFEAKYQEVQVDIPTLGLRAAIDKALGITPPRTNDDPPTVPLIDLAVTIGTVKVIGDIEELDISLSVGL